MEVLGHALMDEGSLGEGEYGLWMTNWDVSVAGSSASYAPGSVDCQRGAGWRVRQSAVGDG
jgi:hypothetical protein